MKPINKKLIEIQNVIYKGLYSKLKGRIYGAEIVKKEILLADFDDNLVKIEDCGGFTDWNGQPVDFN